MNEILQLVHEIGSFPDVLYKRAVLKNSQINTRSSHSEVFCLKDILKNFAKFTEKHLRILKGLNGKKESGITSLR